MRHSFPFQSPRQFPRRGILLLDVAVGLVLTATVMTVLVQAVFQLSDHRHERKTRQIAIDTLMNVNEMMDFDTLIILKQESPEYREFLNPFQKISTRALPGGEFFITELPTTEQNTVQIQLTVSYREGVNRPRREYSIVRTFAKRDKGNFDFSINK